MLHDTINTYELFFGIIDTNFVLVTSHYNFSAYIVSWSNALFEYHSTDELLPKVLYYWHAESSAGGLRASIH